ncbi:MAG TPA: HAMP domain-containing sensor histidine kinase [Solirubrobacteraceae bacterium]|jgi:two-component system sensor histidine kinase MprB|nr:HAMP domain-containing sensor histidine kinase [Solirubrobacteraceae bacterium]
MTLRTRIAAVASVSVALAVLAAAIGLYVAVSSELHGQVDSSLHARARTLSAHAGAGAPRSAGGGVPSGGAPGGTFGGGPPGAGPGADEAQGGADGFPNRVEPVPFGAASGYVQFISPQGQVFVPGGQGSAPSKIALTAGDRAIAERGSGSSFTDRSVAGTQLRVLTLGTASGGAVMVAQPLTQVNDELSHVLLILALIGAGGVVLAALLGALVARTALAPIGRFTERTEQLSGNLDLSHRLEVEGRDELARLAESFNGTLDALERSLQAQRHLIADASHELRTPISSLRANIQVLGEAERLAPEEQASLREDIVAELDELTALVGDVVELARGGASDGSVDDVRLDAVVRDTVARAGRRADRHEVDCELALEPTIVRGQADRIGRAVSNLVDNARKWSPAGAAVEIALEDGVLSVRDHGPGFQDADLPFVFDRFYRARDARRLPGSGLGLAIVRQAAEACGGFAEAQNAPDGGALLRVGFGPVVQLESSSPAA